MPSADRILAGVSHSASKVPEISSWREQARVRFAHSGVSSIALWVLGSLALVVYLVATGISGHRQLWHDELYTYYVAKAPTLSQMFSELRLDLNPPLEYLAVRGSLAAFGDNEYATRLPSIGAFLIGSLCFFHFVARRLDPYFGLLALLAVWATPFFSYSTEARPYGLVFGWFGLAMLAWDTTSQPGRSRLAVPFLAACITGMMLSHIFSLLFIAPFCLAEAWRVYRSRKINWPIWASLLLPTLIPLAFVKLMARFEASLFPPIFEASPRKLGAFYYHTLVPEAPAFALAIILALLLGFRPKSARTNSAVNMTSTDAVFTIGLLAIPELVMALLMKTHGAFFPRYAILVAFGYALVLTFALARLTERSRLAAFGASVVLLVYLLFAVKSAYDVRQIAKAWPAKEAALANVRPHLPLVAASGLTYLEMSHYAAPSIVKRLYYLTDRNLAIKYAHATMFQDFANLQHYFPMPGTVEPYRQFVLEHPQFLVFGTPEWPEDWLIRCLYDIHATVQPAGYFGGPYKDFQLFEVTMPRTVNQGSPR